MYFSTFVFANESCFFLCRVLSFIFYWFGMVRGKLTIPERWQAVGMHSGGFSHATDCPRAVRPRKTTPREDRLISRRAWQRPFSTAGALHGNLVFGGHISTHCNQTPPPSGNASTTTHKMSSWHYVITILDLTGHMIIWGILFAHGDGSTGLMKVVFYYALPTVVPGFGTNETLHFRTSICWAQLLLGVGV